jgi:hypothetical protein
METRSDAELLEAVADGDRAALLGLDPAEHEIHEEPDRAPCP